MRFEPAAPRINRLLTPDTFRCTLPVVTTASPDLDLAELIADTEGEIVRLVAECIQQKTAAEWFEMLDAAGIPAGPINRVGQAFADVQAQHRAMVRTIGGVPLVGSPVRIDGERCDSELPPPALGEHTDEVLREIGVNGDEVERLRAGGVVA